MSARDYTLTVHRPDQGLPYLRAQRVNLPCLVCHGAGFERYEERGYSYVRNCPTCKRLDALVARFEEARLPADLIDARLDAWEANGKRPNPSGLRQYLDEWQRGTKGRGLFGTPGVGKSWLMGCVVHELIVRGHRARWVNWRALLDGMLNCYAQKKPDSAIVDPLLVVDVLAVDDLGAAQDSDFARRVAERVIGDRLTAGQSVMFTTNLRVTTPEAPGTFEDYVGDRVWSRINGNMTCAILGGDDMRPKSAVLRAKHGG